MASQANLYAAVSWTLINLLQFRQYLYVTTLVRIQMLASSDAISGKKYLK